MKRTEQYELGIERIRSILTEETTKLPYRDYFRSVAAFILQIDKIWDMVSDNRWDQLPLENMGKINTELYADILGNAYEFSYANPAYATERLGKELGQYLCVLYAEIRGEIAYVFEEKEQYITICNELFIEIYNLFEMAAKSGDSEVALQKEVQEAFYWHMSDYCDVFLNDRILEQIDPSCTFVTDRIMKCDLSDLRYLYRFGEYITDNQKKTAEYLARLPEKEIQKMADVYTEGYRIGFQNTGKDLSIKSTVNIRYQLGFERVVRTAITNFRQMGLSPVIYRAAVNTLNKRGTNRIGYSGEVPNKQYDYDHRNDQGLFLDKKLIARKLEVLEHTYEKHKELAAGMAGPAVMEVFGEEPFAPEHKDQEVKLTQKQEQLQLGYGSRASQIVNQYIKGEERSFTIIAYPIPAIGQEYEKIFEDTIRMNTLDASAYERIQQTIIDTLNKGSRVHILGNNGNRTDLTVALQEMKNPDKETIFENCVADVNIPVGEVFTSPCLEGTEGILHVTKVFLNELQYLDLELSFQDGMVKDYRCGNFPEETSGKEYIHDNLLFRHDTLPMGEFAIGTNTTAYVMAEKYGIQEKIPILIAEKMGPHFAIGDTCYSWEEDNHVYNPDGKEIIAKENSCSVLRKTNPEKAYFQCHTDITIPYKELGLIEVETAEGTIPIVKDGRFVLPGTETLNEPLDGCI